MKKPKKPKRTEPPYEVGVDGLIYSRVPKDEDGWVDANIYRPLQYDLVRVKTQDKTKPAWWNGFVWEGLRIREGDLIFFWKVELEGREYAS